jgi:hypothetical protein
MTVKAECGNQSVPPHVQKTSAISKANRLISILAHDFKGCKVVIAVPTKDRDLGSQQGLTKPNSRLRSPVPSNKVNSLSNAEGMRKIAPTRAFQFRPAFQGQIMPLVGFTIAGNESAGIDKDHFAAPA